MIKDSENLIPKILNSSISNILFSGKIGIEKESIRAKDAKISTMSHFQELGSSLFNRYITTDFSESQLELITPPFNKNELCLKFLNNIHHFVNNNIDDEYLWPLSMPPYFKSEEEVPIAFYGNSNLALFKETYRNGLANRYGKAMQAISGIHFNYSLPEELWTSHIFQDEDMDQMSLRNSIYFRTVRNLVRLNWLVLYLYGCSPIINDVFRNKSYKFKKLNNNDYFLPYATSLRMSDMGYKNSIQDNLFISLNDLEHYIKDLKKATQVKSDDFEKIYNKTNESRSQLNSNRIQIEDEYYAVARPKNSSNLDIRMLEKLNTGGINYIELRSIDLNPFSNIGIDEEMAYFLEILMIYATFSSSQPMSENEYKISNQNDLNVSIRGREPNLLLSRNGARVSLQEWGLEVIESMETLLDSIDVGGNKYLYAISKAKEKILNVEKTPSDIFLKTIEDQKIEMLDFGKMKGETYKAQFLQKNIDTNKDWDILDKEVSDSLLKFESTTTHEKISFDEFLKEYLNS